MSLARDGRVLVVTAVQSETSAVLAAVRRPSRIAIPGFRAWEGQVGPRPVTIVQAGVGPARARAAFDAILTAHSLVVSIGFAGGLVADALPGDVVLPRIVLWENGPDPQRYSVPTDLWTTAEARVPTTLRLRALAGPMLSSSIVVASPAAKRAAAERTGAVAVEMEAAALIEVARTRGMPVLVLRAILDTVDVSLEHLPPDLDSSWRARVQLVGRPAAWPGVVQLARQIPHVARVLREASAAVLAGL